MRPYNRVYATVDLDAVVSNMKSMREALPATTGIMGRIRSWGCSGGTGHGSVCGGICGIKH